MKTYKLEVILDENGAGVHEKTSEGFSIQEARQIIAILEEYKARLLGHVMVLQSETNLKESTKQ